MNIDEMWVELLALVLTSSGGTYALKEFIAHRKKVLYEREHRNMLDGLRSIANVYTVMERLKETDYVDRVILLEISNQGHAPKAGSKMFARAICVKHDDEKKELELTNKYNEVLIDDAYIKMCIEVQTTKEPYTINTASHPDSLITNFYKAEGVNYSEVHWVHTDVNEKKMFILSIATSDEEEKFDVDRVRSSIIADVSEIRSQFNRYRN